MATKKLSLIAPSNIKVEYQSIANAIVDVIWVQSLLLELIIFHSSTLVFLGKNLNLVTLIAYRA